MKKIYLILFITLSVNICVKSQIRLEAKDAGANISFVGKQFPDIKINEWVGKAPKIKGRYKIIDFWGIFAYPCTSLTTPQLNTIQKKLKRDVIVIGMSADDAFYIKQVEDPKFKYPVCSVDWEQVMKLFNFDGLPITLIVNPQGKVIWQGYVLKPNIPLTEKDIFFLTVDKVKEIINRDKNEQKIQ